MIFIYLIIFIIFRMNNLDIYDIISKYLINFPITIILLSSCNKELRKLLKENKTYNITKINYITNKHLQNFTKIYNKYEDYTNIVYATSFLEDEEPEFLTDIEISYSKLFNLEKIYGDISITDDNITFTYNLLYDYCNNIKKLFTDNKSCDIYKEIILLKIKTIIIDFLKYYNRLYNKINKKIDIAINGIICSELENILEELFNCKIHQIYRYWTIQNYNDLYNNYWIIQDYNNIYDINNDIFYFIK